MTLGFLALATALTAVHPLNTPTKLFKGLKRPQIKTAASLVSSFTVEESVLKGEAAGLCELIDNARVTSRDVRERDTRSSTLIAALPAIERARQGFFNWQEKIRIVAVARLCYPGVRDEPFPIVKKSSKLGLVGTRVLEAGPGTGPYLLR